MLGRAAIRRKVAVTYKNLCSLLINFIKSILVDICMYRPVVFAIAWLLVLTPRIVSIQCSVWS